MMPTVKFSWPISTTLMFRSVPGPWRLTTSTSSLVMEVAVVGFVFAPWANPTAGTRTTAMAAARTTSA